MRIMLYIDYEVDAARYRDGTLDPPPMPVALVLSDQTMIPFPPIPKQPPPPSAGPLWRDQPRFDCN